MAALATLDAPLGCQIDAWAQLVPGRSGIPRYEEIEVGFSVLTKPLALREALDQFLSVRSFQTKIQFDQVMPDFNLAFLSHS
jgi:hypothetical protein